MGGGRVAPSALAAPLPHCPQRRRPPPPGRCCGGSLEVLGVQHPLDLSKFARLLGFPHGGSGGRPPLGLVLLLPLLDGVSAPEGGRCCCEAGPGSKGLKGVLLAAEQGGARSGGQGRGDGGVVGSGAGSGGRLCFLAKGRLGALGAGLPLPACVREEGRNIGSGALVPLLCAASPQQHSIPTVLLLVLDLNLPRPQVLAGAPPASSRSPSPLLEPWRRIRSSLAPWRGGPLCPRACRS